MGDKGLEALIGRVESGDAEVPKAALEALAASVRHWRGLGEEIAKLTALLLAKAKADPVVKRLMAVPGVGPLGALVFVNKVNDPKRFKCGRDCSAWLGFVPNEHSTAHKHRLGSITQEGDEGLANPDGARCSLRSDACQTQSQPQSGHGFSLGGGTLEAQAVQGRSCGFGGPQYAHAVGPAQTWHEVQATSYRCDNTANRTGSLNLAA